MTSRFSKSPFLRKDRVKNDALYDQIIFDQGTADGNYQVLVLVGTDKIIAPNCRLNNLLSVVP